MKKCKFRIAAYTDSAGKTNADAPRNGNEDNMFVSSDLSSDSKDCLFAADREEILNRYGCLMVVADGMGGMNAGEVASEIAINVVKESFTVDSLSNAVLKNEKSRAHFMESVVVAADDAIKEHAKKHTECDGMGSTIVMAWLYEGKVTVTWCGDSRVYLYRESEGLKQISKDHSYVQELVDQGKITMDEAFDHPYNNVITRSLGDPNHKAKPDSVTIPVFRGDIILVNSDGLSGVLRDIEIEKIIKANRTSMNGCRLSLWDAAKNADWYDNVTAILCEILDGPDYDPTKVCRDNHSNSSDYIYFRLNKKVLLAVLALIPVILIACAVCRFVGDHQTFDQQNLQNGNDSTVVVSTAKGSESTNPTQNPDAANVKASSEGVETITGTDDTVNDTTKGKLTKATEN